MKTVTAAQDLRSAIGDWRRSGDRIGFVPTMGNLHTGHLDLVGSIRRLAERSLVSIFVNPLQFGPDEDFERYPRTLGEDTTKLRKAGVDLLFLPEVAEMYPQDRQRMSFVEVPGLSDDLCGRFRPGHFRGVTTVVCKLLNLVQPDCAAFGEKDFQQLTIIRRMVVDLNLPVELVAVPTRREPDGLALSSRNAYLSADERTHAAALYRALQTAARKIEAEADALDAILASVKETLRAEGFRTDYVDLRRAEDLAPTAAADHDLILLAAAWLGNTRLIDNHRVSRLVRQHKQTVSPTNSAPEL